MMQDTIKPDMAAEQAPCSQPPPFTLENLRTHLHDVVAADKALAQARARVQTTSAVSYAAASPSPVSPKQRSPPPPRLSVVPMMDLSLQARRASMHGSKPLVNAPSRLPRRRHPTDPAVHSTPLALPDLTTLRQAWHEPHNWSPSLTSSLTAAQSTASSSLNAGFAASSASHFSMLASDSRRGCASTLSPSTASLTVSPSATTISASSSSSSSDDMLLDGNNVWPPHRYTQHDLSAFGQDEPTVIIRMKRCASCGGIEMPVSEPGGQGGALGRRRKTVCYACGLRFARVAQQSSSVVNASTPTTMTIQQRRRQRLSGSDAVDAARLLSQNAQACSQEGEPLKRMHLHMTGSGRSDGGDGGGSGTAPWFTATMATAASTPSVMHAQTPQQLCNVAESDAMTSEEDEEEQQQSDDMDQESDASSSDTITQEQATHHAAASTRRFPRPERLCDKTFSTRGHGRRHCRSVHKEAARRWPTVRCPYEGCEVTFTRKDNCNQHVRLRHGERGRSVVRDGAAYTTRTNDQDDRDDYPHT